MTWDSGEGVCSSSSFLCVLCSGTKDAEVSKSTLLRSQSCWWGLSFKYGIGQNIAQHAYKNSTFVSCVFPVHSFLCDSNLPSSFFSLQFPSSQFILYQPPQKTKLFSDIRLQFSGSVRLVIRWKVFLPQVTCIWWTGFSLHFAFLFDMSI